MSAFRSYIVCCPENVLLYIWGCKLKDGCKGTKEDATEFKEVPEKRPYCKEKQVDTNTKKLIADG